MTRQEDALTYEAAQSFSTVIRGREYTVTIGDRAAAEHELVKTHPALFRPLLIQYPADEVAVKEPRVAEPPKRGIGRRGKAVKAEAKPAETPAADVSEPSAAADTPAPAAAPDATTDETAVKGTRS